MNARFIRISTIVCSILLALNDCSRGADRPVPEVKKVLIISIDGGRPDLLLRADTPNLRALRRSGSYTMWAHTTDIAITLPSHMSMLTGVKPPRHGIMFNDDRATTQPTYPSVPTIFDLAKQHGYSTAVA